MAGPGELENIQELVEPIKSYIRGVCAIIHDSDEFDEGASYLLKVNNELGAGNVIFGAFVQRHDHSRNRILYETGMKEGDWYIQTDCLERPKSEFLQKVPDIINSNPDLAALFYYGKPYLIKFQESLFYKGNPHESLQGIKGQKVEYSQYEPNEKIVRENVRPLKRPDKFGWVRHYARYHLYPDSNQCLLGAEHRGDIGKIFHEREIIRKRFISELDLYTYSKDVEGMIKMLYDRRDDPVIKDSINKEKIIQDVFRLYVLEDWSVIDEHKWKTVKMY